MTAPPYDGLCIGGPLDGKRRSRDRVGFVAPVLKPLPPLMMPYDPLPVASSMVESCEYRYEGLKMPSGVKVGFWRPYDMPLEEMFAKLVKSYEAARGDRNVGALDKATLERIESALFRYHRALSERKHGGVAAAAFVEDVETILRKIRQPGS